MIKNGNVIYCPKFGKKAICRTLGVSACLVSTSLRFKSNTEMSRRVRQKALNFYRAILVINDGKN